MDQVVNDTLLLCRGNMTRYWLWFITRAVVEQVLS